MRLNKEIRQKIVDNAYKASPIPAAKKELTRRNTVAATLESFKTVEKLLEEWPEAKALIPKDVEAASKPMPLALQTDELNKLIGLTK